MRVKCLIFLILISGRALYSQTSQELPYQELPKNTSKEASMTFLASKMLDSIGHKYFWATDNLIQKDLENSFQSNNVPRLYINGMFIMSLKMTELTDNPSIAGNKTTMTFDKLRNKTLVNIKNVSDYFSSNTTAITSVNWVDFFELLDGLDYYNDNIKDYRKRVGLPLNSIFDEKPKSKSALDTFEEQIGADGVTNKQWMKIMEAGGGPNAHLLIARQKRANSRVVSQMKKARVNANVSVGELKQIKPYSKSVEDIKYTYYYKPPEQLSFVYDSDSKLIIGLIDWIISINAGRSAKLSDVFRIGLNSKLLPYEEYVIGTSINNRKVIDIDDNSILLRIEKRYINKDKFWDIPIDEVQITKENEINFIRKRQSENAYGNKEVVVLSIINTDGSLLERIKKFIKDSRNGNIDSSAATLKLRQKL